MKTHNILNIRFGILKSAVEIYKKKPRFEHVKIYKKAKKILKAKKRESFAMKCITAFTQNVLRLKFWNAHFILEFKISISISFAPPHTMSNAHLKSWTYIFDILMDADHEKCNQYV